MGDNIIKLSDNEKLILKTYISLFLMIYDISLIQITINYKINQIKLKEEITKEDTEQIQVLEQKKERNHNLASKKVIELNDISKQYKSEDETFNKIVSAILTNANSLDQFTKYSCEYENNYNLYKTAENKKNISYEALHDKLNNPVDKSILHYKKYKKYIRELDELREKLSCDKADYLEKKDKVTQEEVMLSKLTESISSFVSLLQKYNAEFSKQT